MNNTFTPVSEDTPHTLLGIPFSTESDAHIKDITPDLAKKMLKLNRNNFRDLNESTVRDYASAMRTGDWSSNGTIIRFNQKGELIDGQHRLSAVVVSKITLRVVVLLNVESDLDIDTGKSRTLGQHLRSRGEKNSNLLAATIRIVLRFDEGSSMLSASAGGGIKVPAKKMLGWLDNNPSVRDSVDAAKYRSKRRPVPDAFVSFIHFVATRAGMRKVVDEFLKQLVGENVLPGSAVASLHSRLSGIDSPYRTYTMAILIKTWNSFKNGRPVNRVFWNSSRENFPRMDLGAPDPEIWSD